MASDSGEPMRLQFSLRTLIIFVLILGPIVAITWAILSIKPRRSARFNLARYNLYYLNAALERYKTDFAQFPPENVHGKTTDEILNLYLGSTLKNKSGNQFGPYLDEHKSYFQKNDQTRRLEIITPWGIPYVYKIIRVNGEDFPLIIDPGPDKLLGGTIDPEKGFVPDNSDANHDGVPDYQDNITNETGK